MSAVTETKIVIRDIKVERMSRTLKISRWEWRIAALNISDRMRPYLGLTESRKGIYHQNG